MSTRENGLVRATKDGPIFQLLGDCYRLLLVGADTGGQFAWMEAVIGPGNGPPPHVHRNEAETFHILEGELSFQVGRQQVTAGRGGSVHVPMGLVHTFRNDTDGIARALIQTAPAGFEAFVRECGEPVPADTPPRAPTAAEIERVLAVAPSYGIQIPTL